MDITYLGEGTVKIKGKKGSLVVNPVKTTKTMADTVVMFQNSGVPTLSSDLAKEIRLTIVGPGEYEVAGIKINAQQLDSELIYSIVVDGMEVLLVRSEALDKAHGKVKSCTVAVVQAETPANASLLLSLSPSAIVVYGSQAGESVKGLGKEVSASITKYTITKEKLPAELEAVILG